MQVTELLNALAERGIRVRAEGGQLIVNAPKGAVTPELANQVRERKPELIAMLEELSSPRQDAHATDLVRSEEATGTVSYAQERIWAITRMHPGSADYNLPGAWRLRGPLDQDALEAAVRKFVNKHSLLHSRFRPTGDGGVRLEPIDGHTLELGRHDVSTLPPEDREATVRTWMENLALVPFDLAEEAPFRASVARLGPEEFVFYVVTHGIVWDAWSFDVMLEDVGHFYLQERGLPHSKAPEPAIRYDDYAAWQRRRQDSDSARRDLAYWKQRLDTNLDLLDFPTDHPRPRRPGHEGARHNFRMPEALAERLFSRSRTAGTTPFMVLLTAYAAVAGRYAGRDTVVVTTPVRGREEEELEGLIGTFTNNLFLPVDLGGNPTFEAAVGRVRDTALEGFARQSTPVELLMRELDVDLGNTALFQLNFTYQNADTRPRAWGDVAVEAGPTRNFHATHGDLVFWVREAGKGLVGAVDYRTDLFEADSIERFVTAVFRFLEHGLTDPGQPVADIPLMSEEEERRLQSLGDPARAAADAPREADLPDDAEIMGEGWTLTVADLRDEELNAADTPGGGADVTHDREAVTRALGALMRAEGSAARQAAAALAAGLGLQASDRVLVPGPADDATTHTGWLAALSARATLLLPASTTARDEAALHALVREWRPTHIVVPPDMAFALAELDSGSGALADITLITDIRGPEPADFAALAQQAASLRITWAAPVTRGACLIGHMAPGDRRIRMHPVPGVAVRVLDRHGALAPPGLPGDVHVSAPRLHRTVEADADAAPWVACKGMSARWTDDGALQPMHRVPDAAESLDLHAVTSHLLTLPGVVDAHCRLSRPTPGTARLLVWVAQALGEESTTTDLRRRLQAVVSLDGLPVLIISVDRIPRNADGQVVDGALEDPFALSQHLRFEPPKPGMEQRIARIWSDLLHLDRVSAHDSFADLGGNSLQALRVMQLIAEQTGWHMEPRLLFFQTLRQIAERAPARAMEQPAEQERA